jgi:hypothetical protein
MKESIEKKKIVLGICIIFVLFLGGYIFLSLNYQKQMILDANKENLQTLANEKASQVNTFFESQKEKLEIIASMNVFKEAVLYPNDTAKIEIARNRINELKYIVPGISLMNSDGIVSIGDVDLPGADYSQHPYFLAKRQDIMFTRYYDSLRKEDYYAIIGPLYDTKNGSKMIGRIAFDIELGKINLLMKETVDSETNEVYLIDENGLLLSGSEYVGKGNKNGVLIQEVKSDGAKICLEDIEKYHKDNIIEEHDEEVFQYENYMGEDVYGAHAYVPSIMGCVLAEKSVEEVSKSSLTGDITNILKKEVKDEE